MKNKYCIVMELFNGYLFEAIIKLYNYQEFKVDEIYDILNQLNNTLTPHNICFSWYTFLINKTCFNI